MIQSGVTPLFDGRGEALQNDRGDAVRALLLKRDGASGSLLQDHPSSAARRWPPLYTTLQCGTVSPHIKVSEER